MNQPLPIAEARDLLARARQALVHSLCLWSGFAVGAALRCADGTIVTGCNIESPTLLQEICAERVTLFKALSDGHRAFTHLAVVAGKKSGLPPCGVCRQLLIEFAPDLIVITPGDDGEPHQRPLAELLPEAFLKP